MVNFGRVILVSVVLLCGVMLTPGMQSQASALAGCCVCDECSGGSTQICDEQQTGSAQCDDFCDVQGCDPDGTFVGGIATCAGGCNGNFGGGGQTPVPTNTPTSTPTRTSTPTLTTTPQFESICNDDLDNDLDGLIDCLDPDCIGQPQCTTPAPAMRMTPLLILAILMAFGGLGILARRVRLI
jgi:hypothetical protein